MDTLNIALLDLNNQIGGGQIAIYNIAEAISKKGHNVDIIIGKTIPKERIQNFSLNNVNLTQIHGYGSTIELFLHEKVIKKELEKIIDEKKYDVINAHGLSGRFLPKKTKNLILTLHGNSQQRMENLVKYSLNNKYMRKTVSEIPLNFTKDVLGHKIHSILEKNLCKRANRIIALTKTEKKYIEQNYQIKDEKISIVPNVIVNPKSDKKEYTKLSEKKIILSVGALSLIKGVPLLIEAIKTILSENNEIMFISAGDGVLKYKLVSLQKQYPENIMIFPYVSDVTSLYQQTSLLIHSSIFEAHSLAICEAMNERKPVIANNIASIPDLVIPGFNGFLCTPGEPGDLAEKTSIALNSDDLLKKMGGNAKKFVSEKFDAQKISSMLEKVYKGYSND